MPDFSGWVCPAPLRSYPTIVLGHGSGGKMTHDLIEHLFAPHVTNTLLDERGDSAVFEADGRMAFTTDSFVINPLIFPGGNIGSLAVHGTLNDLAMSGAVPQYLSAGFILEEGLPMETLAYIAEALGMACREAGVQLIAADTKVVNKGNGDGIFINTTGVGRIPDGIHLAAERIQPGDVVIVNGTMGDHGMAIMSVRHGLEFESAIISDSASLSGLVIAMLGAAPDIHAMRDATRGGLAAALNELAVQAGVGIAINERDVPLRQDVQAACEMLGLDPLFVANEGKLVAFVRQRDVDAVLAAMHAHPLGKNAAVIGRVTDAHAGMVVARTGIGGSRVIDLPAGELLPRIC